jgi:hypothetical protein
MRVDIASCAFRYRENFLLAKMRKKDGITIAETDRKFAMTKCVDPGEELFLVAAAAVPRSQRREAPIIIIAIRIKTTL